MLWKDSTTIQAPIDATQNDPSIIEADNQTNTSTSQKTANQSEEGTLTERPSP